MKNVKRAAMLVLLVLGLGVTSGQALASTTASMHGCQRSTVTYRRVFSAQQRTYRVRIQGIRARGIRCQEVGG
jgi:hypothetical protein